MNSGRGDIITIDIEKSIHQKLLTAAKSKNTSLRKLTNEILQMNLEKEQFIKKIAPRFSLMDFSEDAIVIKDEIMKKTRLAMIVVRNGKLWCDLEEKDDCEHIHYVLMLPQLSRIDDKLKQI